MNLLRTLCHYFATVLALIALQAGPVHAATVSGTLTKWFPVTLDFNGPQASETDTNPNPFLDYRLSVNLTSPSGREILVPGFFAGNGQGSGTGSVWRIRFSPDEAGTWQYNAQLRRGTEVAISLEADAGQPTNLSDASGQFNIDNRLSTAPGFLSQGRLNYIGEHYLKFDDGGYWLKGGTDSPENLLGYEGIDGTQSHGGIEPNFLHRFSTHEQDWRDSDPLFQSNRTATDSRGLIGALNYLHSVGVNSVYLLPMNLGGDGQDTYPFVGANNNRFDKTHYDISKLYQWNQVFSHAQRQSIFIHFVLSETEPANERWLDNGALGVERKLFFRELVARFGYLLAAKWNLGEENDFPVSELRQHAQYLTAIDWSNKPVTVHTQINDFSDYEQIVGDPLFSATSIQYDWEFAGEFVERWRSESANRGHPWVLDMDENTGGVAPGNVNNRRKQILYDVYFSGGQIEWYFGLHPLPLGGDINAENFRLREDLWNFTRHAREFMENELPFWEMQPADNLVTGESSAFGGAEVFAKAGDVYAVYLPQANQSPRINLEGASGNFSLRWFNPRNGQFEGATRTIDGGFSQALGTPPSATNDDWVVLIKREGFEFSQPSPSADVPIVDVIPEPIEAPIILDTDPATEPQVTELSEDTPVVNEISVDDVVVETIQVTEPVNTATPEFVAFENPTATPNTTLSFVVAAIDDDGVAPAMTVQHDLPPGMQLSGSGGLLEFEWAVPADQTENVVITVVAIDAQNPDNRTSMDIVISINLATVTEVVEAVETVETVETSTTPQLSTINQAPVFLSLQNQAIGTDIQANIPTIAIDPDGFVPNVWSNNLPDGASLIDNGDGTRLFSWVPTVSQIGLHTIELEVQDAIDPTLQSTVQWQLEVFHSNGGTGLLFDQIDNTVNGNLAPLFPRLLPQEVVAGETLRFLVNPIDPEGIAPHLQLSTVLPGAEFNDTGNGARILEWTPTPADVGVYSLEFIATDAVDDALNAQLTVELRVVGN